MAKFKGMAAYRNAKASRQTTFDVEMPSGAVFTLRPVSFKTILASGQLPNSYLVKMIDIGKAGQSNDMDAVKEIVEGYSSEEVVADLVYTGMVVRESLVTPRIVDRPADDKECTFEELDDADIRHIVLWNMASAGRGVDGELAAKFRSKQDGTLPISNDDEVRRAASIGDSAH